jgi:hypothetical protein
MHPVPLRLTTGALVRPAVDNRVEIRYRSGVTTTPIWHLAQINVGDGLTSTRQNQQVIVQSPTDAAMTRDAAPLGKWPAFLEIRVRY